MKTYSKIFKEQALKLFGKKLNFHLEMINLMCYHHIIKYCATMKNYV